MCVSVLVIDTILTISAPEFVFFQTKKPRISFILIKELFWGFSLQRVRFCLSRAFALPSIYIVTHRAQFVWEKWGEVYNSRRWLSKLISWRCKLLFTLVGQRSHIERRKKSSLYLVVTPSNATNQNKDDVLSLRQTEEILFLTILRMRQLKWWHSTLISSFSVDTVTLQIPTHKSFISPNASEQICLFNRKFLPHQSFWFIGWILETNERTSGEGCCLE